MCTESIKHKKENVPHINWPTTLILEGEGQNTVCPQPFHGGGGVTPAPLFTLLSVHTTPDTAGSISSYTGSYNLISGSKQDGDLEADLG